MRTSRLGMAVAAAALLVGGAAVADFYLWSSWRQMMQRQVDSAALSSARQLRATGSAPDVISGRGFDGPLLVEHPPAAGFHAGEAAFVRVRGYARRGSMLGRLAGGAPAEVEIRSTAGLYHFEPGGIAVRRVE